MNIDKYILCFDTDKYAGNFERKTTAYATGVLGDCGVGDKEATLFFAETDGVPESILEELEDALLQIADPEDGCHRPCAIQPTPGWVNDGMGTHYRQSKDVPPTAEQIGKYRKSCRDSQEPHLKSHRECTAKGIANWTPEALECEEQKFRDIETKVPRWFPAYNSVGIYLNQPLSIEAFQFVVSRAKTYLTSQGVTLEQVRLVTVFSDEKSEVLSYCG